MCHTHTRLLCAQSVRPVGVRSPSLASMHVCVFACVPLVHICVLLRWTAMHAPCACVSRVHGCMSAAALDCFGAGWATQQLAVSVGRRPSSVLSGLTVSEAGLGL